MDLGNIIHNDIMLRFFALYVKIEKKQKNTAKIYSKEIRYQYWHWNRGQHGLLKFCHDKTCSIVAFFSAEKSFDFYSVKFILVFFFGAFLIL